MSYLPLKLPVFSDYNTENTANIDLSRPPQLEAHALLFYYVGKVHHHKIPQIRILTVTASYVYGGFSIFFECIKLTSPLFFNGFCKKNNNKKKVDGTAYCTAYREVRRVVLLYFDFECLRVCLQEVLLLMLVFVCIQISKCIRCIVHCHIGCVPLEMWHVAACTQLHGYENPCIFRIVQNGIGIVNMAGGKPTR